MKMKINNRGQITIPWIYREWVKIEAGDVFEVEHYGRGHFDLKLLTPKPFKPSWMNQRKPNTLTP